MSRLTERLLPLAEYADQHAPEWLHVRLRQAWTRLRDADDEGGLASGRTEAGALWLAHQVQRALPASAHPRAAALWGRAKDRLGINPERALREQRLKSQAKTGAKGARFRVVSTGPLVSVVIPTYNDAVYLDDAIASVASQSYRDLEIIVIDDCSTDHTNLVVNSWRSRDSRVRLVTRGLNGGLASARNTGLALAEGEFVTFLDADDFITPNSIGARVADLLERQDDVWILGSVCGVRIVPEWATPLDDVEQASSPDGAVVDFVSAGIECPFNSMAPLLRTAAFRAIGGFDSELRQGGEDWEAWQRAMRRGYWFHRVAMTGAAYRRRATSMTVAGAHDHLQVAGTLLGNPATGGGDEDVFNEPLSVFQRSLALFERQVGTTARLHASGDRGGASRLLDEIDWDSIWWAHRHTDVTHVLRTNAARALGTVAAGWALRPQWRREALDEAVEHLEGEVSRRLEAARPLPAQPRAGLRDVVWLISDGGPQARLVNELLDSMDDAARSAVCVVCPEDLESAQGASDVLKGEFVWGADAAIDIGDQAPRIALGVWPYGGFTHRVLGRTTELGGLALTVATGAVGLLDEAPRGGVVCTPAEAVQKIADSIRSAATQRSAASEAPVVPATPSRHVQLATAADVQARSEREEDNAFGHDGDRLAELRDRFRGERCFIIGNGPSLRDTDLRPLADEYTFAVNAIWLAGDAMPFSPTFYVVEDTKVVEENLDSIRAFKAEYRFFPSRYRGDIGSNENTYFFRMNRGFYDNKSPNFCVPRFSTDVARQVYCGQTVTYMNLQFAHYLGFDEVYLIGLDFSYSIPNDFIRRGNHIISTGDDPNHFHPDYFGKGRTWKDPKLDRCEVNYEMAKWVYESDGRRIHNATLGGQLEVYPRTAYADVLAR